MYSIGEYSKLLKAVVLLIITAMSANLQIKRHTSNNWEKDFDVGFSQNDKCISRSNLYSVADKVTSVTSTLSFSLPLVYITSTRMNMKEVCFDNDGLLRCAPTFASSMYSSLSEKALSSFFPNDRVYFLHIPWIILLSTISLLGMLAFEKKLFTVNNDPKLMAMISRGNHTICGAIVVLLIVSASSFTTVFQEDCSSLRIDNSTSVGNDVANFCGGLTNCGAVIRSVAVSDDQIFQNYATIQFTLSALLTLCVTLQFFIQDLCQTDQHIHPFEDEDDIEVDYIESTEIEDSGNNPLSLLDELRAAASLAVQNPAAMGGVGELMAENWKTIPTNAMCQSDVYHSNCTICLTPLFSRPTSEKSELRLDDSDRRYIDKPYGPVIRSKHADIVTRDEEEHFCGGGVDDNSTRVVPESEECEIDDTDRLLQESKTAISAQPESRDSMKSSISARWVIESIKSSPNSTGSTSRSLSFVDLIPPFMKKSNSTDRSYGLTDSHSHLGGYSRFGSRSDDERQSHGSLTISSITKSSKDSGNKVGLISKTSSGGNSANSSSKGGSSRVGLTLSRRKRNVLNESSITRALQATDSLEDDFPSASGSSASTPFELNTILGYFRSHSSPTDTTHSRSRSLSISRSATRSTSVTLSLQSTSNCYTPRRSTPTHSTVVEAPCGHTFHKSCLIEWSMLHSTCPVCRADLDGVGI